MPCGWSRTPGPNPGSRHGWQPDRGGREPNSMRRCVPGSTAGRLRSPCWMRSGRRIRSLWPGPGPGSPRRGRRASCPGCGRRAIAGQVSKAGYSCGTGGTGAGGRTARRAGAGFRQVRRMTIRRRRWQAQACRTTEIIIGAGRRRTGGGRAGRPAPARHHDPDRIAVAVHKHMVGAEFSVHGPWLLPGSQPLQGVGRAGQGLGRLTGCLPHESLQRAPVHVLEDSDLGRATLRIALGEMNPW